jgi:hypothetical protein
MAKNETFKIIAQANPASATYTNIFTASASAQYLISTVTIANLAAAEGSYRIALRENGQTLSNKHFIAYDTAVPANDSIALTLGLTINDSDVLTVYASSASIAFGVFGSEII